jgi:hypothetical protein
MLDVGGDRQRLPREVEPPDGRGVGHDADGALGAHGSGIGPEDEAGARKDGYGTPSAGTPTRQEKAQAKISMRDSGTTPPVQKAASAGTISGRPFTFDARAAMPSAPGLVCPPKSFRAAETRADLEVDILYQPSMSVGRESPLDLELSRGPDLPCQSPVPEQF